VRSSGQLRWCGPLVAGHGCAAQTDEAEERSIIGRRRRQERLQERVFGPLRSTRREGRAGPASPAGHEAPSSGHESRRLASELSGEASCHSRKAERACQPRLHRRPPACQATHYPSERISCFFPRGWSRRSQHSVACPGLIFLCWPRQNVSAPHTYRGSVAMEPAITEGRRRHPLRPRNLSVPLYRPIQRSG
jgi:hypothetical protein